MDKVLVCFENKFVEDSYYDDNAYTKIEMKIFYNTINIEKDIKK